MKRLLYVMSLCFLFVCKTYGQEEILKGKQIYSSDFIVDGIPRNITFYMPAGYNSLVQSSLMFFLHGEGMQGKDVIKIYGDSIHSKADADTTIVVYPDAIAKHWNDKMGNSFPATDTINDVGFISIMIDYFVQRYQCNNKKVYIAGFSNGGAMAYRLSFDIPNKITAIAPFLSSISAEASHRYVAAPPMPVVITNAAPSADSTVSYWQTRNHIQQAPVVTQINDNCPGDKSTVTKYVYSAKYPVVVYKINNGVNAVPFPSKKAPVAGNNCDYNSISEAWNFLLQQTKE